MKFSALPLSLLCAALTGASASESDDIKYVSGIESKSRLLERNHAAGWKPLAGVSTDRGAELFVQSASSGLYRLILHIGLSSKDDILEFLVDKSELLKVTIAQRRYFASADADRDFDQPIALDTKASLYFRRGAIVVARTYDDSKASKWMTPEIAKALTAASQRLLAAWQSKKREPDIDGLDMSVLTLLPKN